MSLSPFVRIVARGKGRARPLSQSEAHAAMDCILNNAAEPEAIGALLMVLRLRGEVASEIAGFSKALSEHVAGQLPKADLDWPCYAAGRTRGAPLFLLAAKLVAQAGYRVSLHGWNSHQSSQASVRNHLEPLGISQDSNARISYAPLETLSPKAFELLKLRDVFGLRSCINTVLRMWNPSGAETTIQGVFHPSYRSLQALAAEATGQKSLTIIKGGGGEFERHPSKDLEVFCLRDGVHSRHVAPALHDTKGRSLDFNKDIDPMTLWRGQQSDEFAVRTVIGTAGLALWALGAKDDIVQADRFAAQLWSDRHLENRRLKKGQSA
ncbi:MAG: glycosyl transferase family protein [Rhodobacteraceae bacterium]|nr:glycosyl transferase family protein [Paracoccaceae bacterium]